LRDLIARTLGGVPRAAVAFPRTALTLVALVALAGAAGLIRLELRTDGRALVPPGDPAILADAEVRQRFGLRDPILVYLETTRSEGIFSPEILRSVVALTESFEALGSIGPGQVMSLATEASPRVFPGTLRFRPILVPFPGDTRRMQEVRHDVDETAILTGTLVSADRRATAILVGVPNRDASASPDRIALYREIERLVEPHRTNTDRILVVGAPVAESLLGSHILEDLVLMVPLAMAIVALVVWIGCRRAAGVALALGEVGACLLFTFGIMGWNGTPVYLTTAVLPVILTTIGLTDEIHILWHYQRLLAHEPDPTRAVTRCMEEMLRPVTLTSITTAVGFLSFSAAPIVPVEAFGSYAAVGIGFCWLFTLVGTPAALVLLGPTHLRRTFNPSRAPDGAGRHLLRALFRRAEWTLGAAGVITLALGAGAFHLIVQDSWVEGFRPDSPFRQATERVEARLAGTHVLQVEVAFERSEPPAALVDPDVLAAIGRFEADLRQVAGVGGVLGAHSHLTTVHYLFASAREDRSLPPTTRGISEALRYFDLARGPQRRREVVHDDRMRTIVTLYLKGANYRDTERILQEVRGSAQRHLAPMGGSLALAGDIAVSQALIPAIVRTQLGSLLLSLLGVWVAAALFWGSPREGLWAMLPAGASVVWVFGAMGWLGIPIGVATSTFCAIALGVGVDYAIHFLERVRRVDAVGNPAALANAAAEVAPAIVADALAVALGFGVLAFSSVPANANLGRLVAMALLSTASLTLLGLGAWLARSPAGHRAAAAGTMTG